MRPWIKFVERQAPTGSFVRIQAGQAREARQPRKRPRSSSALIPTSMEDAWY
jgi:hypothetical protein